MGRAMTEIKCRSCGNTDLLETVSLGDSPLANNLLDSIDEPYESYPLKILYCGRCHNSQLSYTVPPQILFDKYLYVSSTTETLRYHFKKAAESYIKEFKLDSNSLVIDIGSNDGIGLINFKEAGIKAIGVEPAANIASIANLKGLQTINSYFEDITTEKILTDYGKVDLITASNVFAHSDLIKNITSNVFKLLKTDGCFIIEAQYFMDTINDVTFDNIYHEHVSYWSVTSLVNFFNNCGYSVVRVQHIETGGGSIRAYIKRAGSYIEKSVYTFLDAEQKFGLKSEAIYADFFENIKTIKKNINTNFRALKDRGLKIVGYGSPAKATTALNYFEIGSDYIDYIVEDNKLKHNKFLPGVNIPILPKNKLKEDKPDVIVILAWNFTEEIKKNNSDLSGIKFISIKDMEKIL